MIFEELRADLSVTDRAARLRLAVAGERDSASVRRSLAPLGQAVPHAQLRVVPAVHHVWSTEDSALFNAVLAAWLDGTDDPRPLTCQN